MVRKLHTCNTSQIQNMNLKFNVKDINKILVKAHYNNKKCKETTHFYERVSLCSLRENFKSPLWFDPIRTRTHDLQQSKRAC
jgi:hypothetical protein